MLELNIVSVNDEYLFVLSPRFQFAFQSFREPYSGKGRRVRCSLARKLAQHGLHGLHTEMPKSRFHRACLINAPDPGVDIEANLESRTQSEGLKQLNRIA